MPTQSEEAKREERLRKRREYYRANRDRIRLRDNETARRLKKKDPERAKVYAERYKAKKLAQDPSTLPDPGSLDDNPEKDEILEKIKAEYYMSKQKP